ncbi:MAG: NusG domain II-containing protein [Coriobacteriia bacterium]|nr:NusG domain II-containing protein [Coriobacteriia bacterium]
MILFKQNINPTSKAALATMGYKQKKNRSVLAVAVIFAVVVFAWGFVLLSNASAGTGTSALVHDGDGGTTKLSLAEDTTKTFTTSYGTNTVVVKNGEVRVESADCDNQDCVHQGTISTADKQIICLPHKLWIEIVSDEGKSGSMDTSKADSFDASSR